MNVDDSLWKGILEDVFDDFLVFFFKEDAAQFDLEKGFEFLDKELEQLFPSGDSKQALKFVDKLVKVFTKAGTEEWVLVHVEVQGYNDSAFAKRMFTYFYRILDHYNKPVTCVAIFTDDSKSYQPTTYNYSYLGTKATFSYNTYKINDQDKEELRRSSNPFAIVILTALVALKKGKVTEETLLDLKTDLIRALLKKQIPKEKARSILIFISNYVRFDNKEITAKFEYELNVLTNNNTTMGIEEMILKRVGDEYLEIGIERGIEIGSNKKSWDVVKKLLIQTDFSFERIADMVGVEVSFVEEVKASLGD